MSKLLIIDDEAVRVVREEKPDLILLDFNLPDITGADVLRTIREEVKSGIKVIMMTGMDEDKIKQEAGRFDIFRYLHKPLTLDALEKIVLAELNA
jgi:DNA-binding response OmpR family regulator